MNKSNPIIMGKGDRKTRRGKIILGTYGVRRRKKKMKKTDSMQLQAVKEKDTKGSRTVRGKKTESEAAKAGEEIAVLKDKGRPEEKQSVKQEEKKSREIKAEKVGKEDREAKADKKIKKAAKSEESGNAS